VIATGYPKGRVLIVDAKPSILESYSRCLTDAGFEVAGASETVEALRRNETGLFDVIFSDLLMPETEGLKFLRRIQVQSPHVPVFVMLDAQDNRIAVQATEAGVVQSLVKPIEPKVLKELAAYGVRLNRTRQSKQSHMVPFRNSRGERTEAASVSATEAKNEFGRVLESAIQGGLMFITKYEAARAVLMSVEEFYALSSAAEVKLNTLSSKFDALLAQMQTSESRAGMKATFDATPEQMGKAAVAALRTRD